MSGPHASTEAFLGLLHGSELGHAAEICIELTEFRGIIKKYAVNSFDELLGYLPIHVAHEYVSVVLIGQRNQRPGLAIWHRTALKLS